MVLGVVAAAAACAAPPLPPTSTPSSASPPSATAAPTAVTPRPPATPATATVTAPATGCVRDFRPLVEHYTCGLATLWTHESATSPDVAFEGAITRHDDVDAILLSLSVPSARWTDPRTFAGGLRMASFEGASTTGAVARGVFVASGMGKSAGSRTAICFSTEAESPCEPLARSLATAPEEWRSRVPPRGHPFGGEVALEPGCELSLNIDGALRIVCSTCIFSLTRGTSTETRIAAEALSKAFVDQLGSTRREARCDVLAEDVRCWEARLKVAGAPENRHLTGAFSNGGSSWQFECSDHQRGGACACGSPVVRGP